MASLSMLTISTNPHVSQGRRRRRSSAVARPRSLFLCQSSQPTKPPAGGGGDGENKSGRWVARAEKLYGNVVKAGMAARESLSPKQKGDWKDVTLMSFSFAVFTTTGSSSQQESQGQSSQPIQIDDDAEEIEVKRSKKKRTSVVWKEFKEVEVMGEIRAQCLYCHKYISGKSSNGTSSLHYHLGICTMRKIKTGGMKGKTLAQSSLRLKRGILL